MFSMSTSFSNLIEKTILLFRWSSTIFGFIFRLKTSRKSELLYHLKSNIFYELSPIWIFGYFKTLEQKINWYFITFYGDFLNYEESLKTNFFTEYSQHEFLQSLKSFEGYHVSENNDFVFASRTASFLTTMKAKE